MTQMFTGVNASPTQREAGHQKWVARDNWIPAFAGMTA